MALELAIIGAVAGLVLSLRFNVLVLVPAVMCAVLSAVIVGVARADGFWSIMLMTVLLSVAVQAGYLAGAALHAVIDAIGTMLVRGRNDPELSTLCPAWPDTLQSDSWQLTTHSDAAIRRPPQPPPV